MQTVIPKIAIVILNYNGLADTLDCLESLQKNVYQNYVVVVIDNGSKGNEAEVIKKRFGEFVYLIKIRKNVGFVGGANIGIRWALSSGMDYVLLMNNDIVVDSKFLVELINVEQNDARIGILGPKVYHYDQPNRLGSVGGRINFWTGVTPLLGKDQFDNGQFDSIREVDFVSGCVLLIKTETIKRIGLLSEIYFTYYEETEWCAKAKKAGFKVVFVPKARIWHKEPISRTSKSATYYMTRNRFLFVRRNSSTEQFIFFIFYFLITDLLFQMRDKLFMKPMLFLAYLEGIYGGLRSLANHG